MYAESAGLHEKPAEEQPLLSPPPLPHRVEDDGGSSPGVSTPHVPGSAYRSTHISPIADCTHTSPAADSGVGDPTERPPEEDPPPLPPRLMDDGASTPPVSDSADQSTPHQVTSDNVAGDPTYAPVLTRTPNAVSQPAATEKVSYEDIQKYQNKQVWFPHNLYNSHVISCLSFHWSFFCLCS